MDCNNTTTVERPDSLDAILTLACGGEEAREGLEAGRGGWLKSLTDRERFQRFERNRKQGAKRNKKIVIDGCVRYADKPYSNIRPRPPSEEYLAFKRELEEARQAKELF